MLKGIGVSPGIVIGKIFKKKEDEVVINKKEIEDIKLEINRLNEAKIESKKQIEELYKNSVKSIGKKQADIFKAHIMVLNDPEFFGKVEDNIVNRKINVEHALKEVTDNYVNMFNAIENEYLRERAADLKDVSNRVIRVLQNSHKQEDTNHTNKRIIVSRDLTPSDTANLDKDKVLGFITEAGGRTSHSAIIARTIGIPAVVGIEGVLNCTKDGDNVILDGEEGVIYINPDSEVIEEYKIKQKKYKELEAEFEKMIGKETITQDGKKIELSANISNYKDIDSVLKNDAEGVGLFRTEFIYMDRESFPNEDEQFEIYKKVGEALNSKPVIIRTLDIGGDKELSYIDFSKEENPFLGYRAIRLCLKETEIFKIQLRAILRASMYGNLKIMFPMISGIKELREAKEILKEVMDDLKTEGIEFSENIEVGIMIEIPSAAITSDILAKEVDFFSIGTNDLIQYTIAVDRMNKKVSYLYDQYHPAVLKLIKLVIENGHKEGIWVGMCGEAAGNSKMIPVLLGMGLDEFSMSPISILKSRWIINNSSNEKLSELSEKVIKMETSDEIIRILDEI